LSLIILLSESLIFSALIPSNLIELIIGASVTFINNILSLKRTFTFEKKFVSYKFFKIKFNLLSLIISSVFISEKIFIVSFEILSLPSITILSN